MNKKLFLVILFAGLMIKGLGQYVPDFSYPNSVNLFDLCEISFKLPTNYINPYNPDTINIYAVFTGPDNSSYTVNAFYYEGYTFHQHNDGYEVATRDSDNDRWKIRFTPNSVGTWSFIIYAYDKNGALNLSFLNVYYTFSCSSVSYANGFITKANSKYLKREIVRRSQKQNHSFFPIGPNVAWYHNYTYCSLNKPLGIYDYEDHIDSLYNKANYMRIWINRYHYLSLYGIECAPPENTTIYFDSLVNQKDAAELDHIIAYASQHNISLMLSIFNQGDFQTNNDNCNPSMWANNPYHTILNLSSPCDFFTDSDAKRITKNLIRYIISRWGYATNVMCWELWNEVDHATKLCSVYEMSGIGQNIIDWHNEMVSYIRSIDPFGHCITSSLGKINGNVSFNGFFQNMDIVQKHNYQDIQRARSRFEIPYSLFLSSNN